MSGELAECVVEDETYAYGESQVLEVCGSIHSEVSNDCCGKTVYEEESKADRLSGDLPRKISDDNHVEVLSLNEMKVGNVSSTSSDKGSGILAPEAELERSTQNHSLSIQVSCLSSLYTLMHDCSLFHYSSGFITQYYV